jgi:hypothetical protein
VSGINPLDDVLPRFEFSERHSVGIAAPAQRIMESVTTWRNRDDPLVRAAMTLRETPARLLGCARPRLLELADFTLLEQQADTALIFGLIGAFWEADYGLRDIPSIAAFRAERHDDVCKLVLGFVVQPQAGKRYRLVTETRISCVTARARHRFLPYWLLICPVSGLIRRRMLSAIRDQFVVSNAAKRRREDRLLDGAQSLVEGRGSGVRRSRFRSP